MLQHAQVQAKIPPKAMWEFYQKLAYDDSFRERLQNHPREVLNEYGLWVSDEYSFCAVTLPPKEDIAKAIQEVTAGREFVIARDSWGAWAIWVIAFLMPAQEQIPVEAAIRRLN